MEARQGELDTARPAEVIKPKGTDQKKKRRSRRFNAMADLVPGELTFLLALVLPDALHVQLNWSPEFHGLPACTPPQKLLNTLF